jgi:NADH-quinone oxidoreductase subunit C
MTTQLDTKRVADLIAAAVPEAVIEATPYGVVVDRVKIVDVLTFLKNDADLQFNFLAAETAVDYPEYFEMVYHLVSMPYNHAVVIKARIRNKLEPEIDSVWPLWKTANFQEREIYDLMGIRFNGHPELRRILLWEGFPGHPLRKDYLWVQREQAPFFET